MWSLPALSTLNALAARVGNREAHRLFTSRLQSDADRANAILAGNDCEGCGDTAPVVVTVNAEADTEAA